MNFFMKIACSNNDDDYNDDINDNNQSGHWARASHAHFLKTASYV